jgi:DNA modification methylase
MEELLISNLTLLDTNPRQVRKGAIERLAKSISSERGKSLFNKRPCLVNKRDGKLIVYAGNQRLRAAQSLGWKTVPCIVEEITLEQEREETIKDNLVIGEWDDDLLANHFDIEELTDWGMDLSDLNLDKGEIEEDEAPVPPADARSKLGQIFTLGRHRLMCGDSTCVKDVDKLMDGQKADMVFTDPPYGMDFQSNFREKTPQFDKIKNDDVVLDVAPVLDGFMNSDTVAYICTRWDLYPQWYEQVGNIFKIKNCIVWYEKGGGLGDLNNSYSPNHEFIIVAHKGTGKLRGKRDADVWQIERDGFNDYTHPTQKPVALSAFAINHHSDKDQNVLDLFLGSGSTLIACEQTNRICYGMELDPKYCDVIIQRYCNFTNTDIEDIYGQA